MPKKIPFTFDDLSAWCKERLTRREVAERMGVSYSTAYSRIKSLDPEDKLKWRPEPHPNPAASYEDFLKLADKQLTRQEAFDELGISRRYGYRRLEQVDPQNTIPWRSLPRSKGQLRALARLYKTKAEAARALNYHPEYFRAACRRIDPEGEVPWQSARRGRPPQSAPATHDTPAPTAACSGSSQKPHAGSSAKVGATCAMSAAHR